MIACSRFLMFCPECGQRLDDEALFCPYCGTRVNDEKNVTSTYVDETTYSNSFSEQQQQDYQPSRYQVGGPHNIRHKEKTIHLKIVVWIGWIGLGLMVLLALGFVVLYGIFIGLIIAPFILLQYWLIKGISDYKNTQRVIYLILTGLGLLSSFANAEILGIVIAVYTIWVLAIHQPTVRLFKS